MGDSKDNTVEKYYDNTANKDNIPNEGGPIVDHLMSKDSKASGIQTPI